MVMSHQMWVVPRWAVTDLLSSWVLPAPVCGSELLLSSGWEKGEPLRACCLVSAHLGDRDPGPAELTLGCSRI